MKPLSIRTRCNGVSDGSVIECLTKAVGRGSTAITINQEKAQVGTKMKAMLSDGLESPARSGRGKNFCRTRAPINDVDDRLQNTWISILGEANGIQNPILDRV